MVEGYSTPAVSLWESSVNNIACIGTEDNQQSSQTIGASDGGNLNVLVFAAMSGDDNVQEEWLQTDSYAEQCQVKRILNIAIKYCDEI